MDNGKKGICFCEESFADRLFLVLEILRGGILCPRPPPPLPGLHKPKKSMVNKTKN